MKLHNKVYDVLKWIVVLVLPAFGTFYSALAGIWGFADPDKVVGTITATTLFLGVILGISTLSYNKSGDNFDGTLTVDDSSSETTMYSLDVGDNLDALATKKQIVLKVAPAASQ